MNVNDIVFVVLLYVFMYLICQFDLWVEFIVQGENVYVWVVELYCSILLIFWILCLGFLFGIWILCCVEDLWCILQDLEIFSSVGLIFYFILFGESWWLMLLEVDLLEYGKYCVLFNLLFILKKVEVLEQDIC